MVDALEHDMKGLDVEFSKPAGGMFLWLRLPQGIDTTALLPHAVERGVAFVPGAPFYADCGDPRTLRLSFVTASEDQIRKAIAALADTIREQLAHLAAARTEQLLAATPH
jgi:2-aminoadipate transaminase